MKKILVASPLLPDKDKYKEMIDHIFDSKWLSNYGPLHSQFLEKLKKIENSENITLHVNGHLGLENILNTILDGEKGKEIITTPFTFISTTHSIANAGFTPVFVDINPNDFCIDYTKIEEAITNDTVAIMGVHVFGQPCNFEEIDKIAKKHSLKVIYDAAHAFGSKYKNLPYSAYGDASMYSFHATKVFNTIEGGLVVFNSEDDAIKSKHLSNFGLTNVDEISYVGNNSKMNEFQAAMGLCNLEIYEEVIKYRKTIHDKYVELLQQNGQIFIPKISENVEYNYSYFPIIIKNGKRDKVQKVLARNNIEARKYFNPLISDLPIFPNTANVPIAREIVSSILVLPAHHDVTIEDVERISMIINIVLGEEEKI